MAGGLQFDVDGYTIAPTGSEILTLAGGSPTIAVTNLGTTATISAILAGTSGFTLSGTGTLVLSGNNAFTGGVTINSGILKLGSARR